VLLSAGSAVNGLLAYVFFALGTRHLGAEATAPVSVLWSYWALAGAVLTFPVQHWIIRRFTADGHEATVARTLPRLCVVVAAVALLSGVVAFVFRGPLFHEDAAAFPAMLAAVTAGSFLMGLVRGVLSGRGRYAATALSLAGENLLRVVVGAAVVWAGLGAHAMGAALVAGPLCGLLWAHSLRLGPGPPGEPVAPDSLALVSGVAGGSLVGQAVLTGAPVVLAVTGGAPAAVTSLFLALAVWRAPYLVALGVTPQLTSVLTHRVLQGPPQRVARTSRVTVLAVAGAAAMAAAVGALALRPVLRSAFGVDAHLGTAQLAGLGVGTVVALGNLVLLLVLLAVGRSRVTTVAWMIALGGAAAWMAAADLTPATEVVTAFVVAEASAFALLAVAVERWAAR
jgi:O-antigen/teichoic acid export membrane protein